MAIRARRYVDAKAQASGNLELLWWVFMRVSGLVLVFLIFGHIYMNFVLVDVNTIDYDYVASRLSNTTWKIYDLVILGLGLLHGLNGMRYVMDDWIRSPARRFAAKMAVYGLGFVAFLIGSISLLNHDFAPANPQNTGQTSGVEQPVSR